MCHKFLLNSVTKRLNSGMTLVLNSAYLGIPEMLGGFADIREVDKKDKWRGSISKILLDSFNAISLLLFLFILNLNNSKSSNIHCHYFLMQLFHSFIISFLFHVHCTLFHFLFGLNFFLFLRLILLFCHGYSLEITRYSFFSKPWQVNLALAFVWNNFGSKRAQLFFKFFLFFLNF